MQSYITDTVLTQILMVAFSAVLAVPASTGKILTETNVGRNNAVASVSWTARENITRYLSYSIIQLCLALVDDVLIALEYESLV